MTNEARRLSYDPDAADRVRRLLSGRGDVVEKKMVGGLSFLINGNVLWHQRRGADGPGRG